jgi:cysteine desulfurase
MSSHKLHGPKGVGALYIRKGTKLTPQMQGGEHERRRRAGTENVPGIVGFAKAVEIAMVEREEKIERLEELRKYLVAGVLERIEEVSYNGHPEKRLPGNANFSFKYIEGESLVLQLDMVGIAVSSGSACASASLEPSHVLLAMGLTAEDAHGSLRVTMGRSNTKEEVDYFLEVLPEVVGKLRMMSPLYAQAR